MANRCSSSSACCSPAASPASHSSCLRELLPRPAESLIPAGRRVPLHRAPSCAIRSSDNQDRNEEKPFKHAPTRTNRHQAAHHAKSPESRHPRRAAPFGEDVGTVILTV